MAILQLDQIEKRFGGLAAVGGVSMEAHEGEILSIVGPNGAGKSTLLKMILGLYKPTSGTITFDGQDITGYPTHRIRQMGIAMAQQTPQHFSTMSVMENVVLGSLFGTPAGYKSEKQGFELAETALEAVGLAERRNDQIGNLTLQQQRFLQIARAIAGRPRILALDEVMAGLTDGELETSIQVVRDIRDRFDLTIIWVEHVMKAVRSLAERTVVLNFGTVLTRGLPEDVLNHPDVIEAYLGTEVSHA
ncbi:MAG: ABC transporter ATP-binding protein [Chloroflexota bacterium]